MNTPNSMTGFEQADLLDVLQGSSDEALDELPFGVIAFDADHRVCGYNRMEAAMANFIREEVLGQNVFVELAPCLNNYLVAGRFEEAHGAGQALDCTMPYVLTFRMRPTRVRMRLLSTPSHGMRYIAIDRQPGSAG